MQPSGRRRISRSDKEIMTKQRNGKWKRDTIILTLLAALLCAGLFGGYRVPQEDAFTAAERLAMGYVWENLYALVFQVFCLLCAAVLVIASNAMKQVLNERLRYQMQVLAALMADAGIWVLTDSELLKLIVRQTQVVAFFSLISFALLVPLTLEFVTRSLKAEPKWLAPVQNAALCFLVMDVAGWLGGLYMFWFLLPIHATIVAGIVLALRSTWREYREEKSPELRDILLGFGLLAVFSVLSMLVFYWNPYRWVYAVFYCVGMLAFLLAMAGAVIRKLQRSMKDWMQAEQYKTLAYRDALTGLANYTAFKHEKARWDERNDWAYLMLDVNWLKQTNDQYGYAAGDALLCGAARCIQEAFFRADGCYRIGGDEFAVVCCGASDAEVEKAVQDLRSLCEHWNQTAAYPVSIAVGCAMQAGRAMTADELLAQADAAMYADKSAMKKKAQNE